MRRLRRSLTVPALVAVTALGLAACGGSSSSGSKSKSGTTTSAVNIASSSKPCTYKFALITHGDNGNFWSVVYKGAIGRGQGPRMHADREVRLSAAGPGRA